MHICIMLISKHLIATWSFTSKSSAQELTRSVDHRHTPVPTPGLLPSRSTYQMRKGLNRVLLPRCEMGEIIWAIIYHINVFIVFVIIESTTSLIKSSGRPGVYVLFGQKGGHPDERAHLRVSSTVTGTQRWWFSFGDRCWRVVFL